ncbi:MAG TPA: response regulator [Rhodanobacteraceae bacterium]|nr:response regulator [Rhodanobacteraceae bacterium]
MIDVVMVDDHELVRTGFRLILEAEDDIRVVGEAGDAEQGLHMIRQLAPQVALVDVHLPGSSGLELTERLRRAHSGTRVVVLTAIDNARLPRRLLEAGALGYLTKGCASEELVGAVRAVARGRRYLAPAVAHQLALASVDQAQSPFDAVSSRELEVALMLVRGAMVKEIATRLHLSPKTVSTYKQRLFEKLEIDNSIALAHLVSAHGLDGRAPVHDMSNAAS